MAASYRLVMRHSCCKGQRTLSFNELCYGKPNRSLFRTETVLVSGSRSVVIFRSRTRAKEFLLICYMSDFNQTKFNFFFFFFITRYSDSYYFTRTMKKKINRMLIKVQVWKA
jgi:hypothetical protein